MLEMICWNYISQTVYAVFIILVSLSSCIKEEFDYEKLDYSIKFTPGVAVPLGFIHYELEEMLDDTLKTDQLYVDNNGFLTLIYEKELFSLEAGDLIDVPDLNVSQAVNNNTPVPIDLSLISAPITDTAYLTIGLTNPGYTEIDSIRVRSLTIAINITTDHNLDGTLRITSPGLLKNGTPWSDNVQLDGSTFSSTLENYTIVLANDPPDVNQLVLIYTLNLTNSSGFVQPGEAVFTSHIGLSEIDYSAIFGYLGQFYIDIDPQTFPINFYDYIVDGTFHFEEPELKLHFKNSYGIPIQIILTEFQGITKDGNLSPITGDSVPSADNPRIINYPGLAQFGQVIEDSVVLDPSNTNLFDVIESIPAEISYGVEGLTNPDGVTHKNFISDESYYSARAELILPLYGYADFMLMMDTIRFDFEDFYQNPPEEIKRLAFRLNVTNGFPISIYSQLYFIDENYAVLDSLFDDRHIITAGSDNDGDGKIDPYRNDPVEVSLTRTKIDHISGTKYLLITGRISTTNVDKSPPDKVKFYADYFLDASIGVIADLEVNSASY